MFFSSMITVALLAAAQNTGTANAAPTGSPVSAISRQAKNTHQSCTRDGVVGSVFTGTVKSDTLTGGFGACVKQGSRDGATQCSRTDFDATLTDGESSLNATGDVTACFGASNPPSYGAFRINSGTGAFAGASGTGLLTVQYTSGNASAFTFIGTVVHP